ncbi:phosphatidylinositol-4-phosphate 5-kinase [Trypanosoma grayi]|uniref:phosphatidylinositol-4-phosphate 5-kinase n=1 Tax=Trypanosoma grayi TaxID=71804 RepID=UPI0004F4354E|nr:phosphatidylinositol-4-phosphate 5-kinase [Trypanosoma grayi]KEG08154.1 phosphatidylinositol-4-phosphate 5-kinase [Trypanosoma grayi]
MHFAKAAAQAHGTGLRDSALKCPVLAAPTSSPQPTFSLTPLVEDLIEEPVVSLIRTEGSGAPGGRQLLRSRAAVLHGGEVRPYTADEMRATAGTEYASGKAVHTFVGHYRQPTTAITTSSQGTLVKEGHGAMYFADGSFFIGQWSNNQRSGLGSLYSALGYSYEGEFKDDVPHGYGVEHFPGDQTYVGDFVGGRPHGHGIVYYCRNGSIHVGDYSRGEKHGSGVVFYENGDVFEGNWVGGRRTGEGICTSVEVKQMPQYGRATTVQRCTRTQWFRDRCKWETMRIDPTHEPPSLSHYLEEGTLTRFDDLESPLGNGVGTLTVAHKLVRHIPPVLLQRLERCFDRMDEAFTGEVPLPTLEATFELHADGDNIFQSILRAAQSSTRDTSLVTHVEFIAFMQGLFPHLSEADICRSITQELHLETLLRLRGVLAGVVSSKKDGFLQLVQTGREGEALQGGGRGRPDKTRGSIELFSLKRSGDCMTSEKTQLTLDQLDAARGFVGGVRVPRGLFLRQKMLDGNEQLDFSEILEGLCPCIPLQALRRCEVTIFPPHVFRGYMQAFAQLDEMQTGSLSIQSMAIAKNRFMAARSRGHEHIPQPLNALERLILPGRRRCQAQWGIADISLSISFAKYIDRFKKGSVTLADVLRHAYPNVPCVVTRNRLMSGALASRFAPHVADLEVQLHEGAPTENPTAPFTSLSYSSCSCCICLLCTTNGLPLGTLRSQ